MEDLLDVSRFGALPLDAALMVDIEGDLVLWSEVLASSYPL